MISRFIKSFSYAFQGLAYTFKTQGNFKFHSFAALIALGLSLYFQITSLECVIIIFCIGLVFFAELVNTAFETLVDLASPDFHPLAKICKDVAAASVLVLAFTALVIGLLIFIPYSL